MLPLKDRRHEAFEDGFCRNTVVDTVRHVPTRSRQSLRKLCYAPQKRGSFSATKQTLSKRYSRRNQNNSGKFLHRHAQFHDSGLRLTDVDLILAGCYFDVYISFARAHPVSAPPAVRKPTWDPTPLTARR